MRWYSPPERGQSQRSAEVERVAGREGAIHGVMICGALAAPEREMGIAAEQHRFAHALRKEVVLALGDDAYHAARS